jgi:hypothetical protein
LEPKYKKKGFKGFYMRDYNTKIITYPSGKTQIIRYSQTIKKIEKKPKDFKSVKEFLEYEKKQKELREKYQEYNNKNRSLRRSVAKIADYLYSNEFDYFMTLTLSPEYDRYNYDSMLKYLKAYLRILRKNDPDLKYLIVHEPHKDGAYHLHGLITCKSLNLEKKIKKDGDFKTYKNDFVYQDLNYRYGFNEFTKVDDIEKAKNYLLKYMVKDMQTKKKIETDLKGKQKYYKSKNLLEPIITNTDIDSNTFEETIKSFDIKRTKNKTYEYDNIQQSIDYYFT